MGTDSDPSVLFYQVSLHLAVVILYVIEKLHSQLISVYGICFPAIFIKPSEKWPEVSLIIHNMQNKNSILSGRYCIECVRVFKRERNAVWLDVFPEFIKLSLTHKLRINHVAVFAPDRSGPLQPGTHSLLKIRMVGGFVALHHSGNYRLGRKGFEADFGNAVIQRTGSLINFFILSLILGDVVRHLSVKIAEPQCLTSVFH